MIATNAEPAASRTRNTPCATSGRATLRTKKCRALDVFVAAFPMTGTGTIQKFLLRGDIIRSLGWAQAQTA